MCSIDEAWAGQNFSGKPVVSQSDIHNSYMSIPDDIMTHNNQFSLKYNEEPKPRNLSRGINSKYSREPRVPKINRSSDNATIDFSSTMPPYNNYGGIDIRPEYMAIYDNASGPMPMMSGENFNDIENAYKVSNTLNHFMNRGEHNAMLDEETFEEREIVNKKINHNTIMNNMNKFTNVKQPSKYNSSDRHSNNSNNNSVVTRDMSETQILQILQILQEVVNKLDSFEYNLKSLHTNQSRNIYDIILYVLFGMILSFLLCSLFSKHK